MDDHRIEAVRRIMGAAEDVDLPEGLSAPHPEDGSAAGDDFGGMDTEPPPPPPQDDGEALPPEARCVDLALNDVGNGHRLIVHFGSDLIYVPRVGWFRWTEQVWRADPDGIEVRRMAHRLSDLIAREIWHIPMTDEDKAVLSDAERAAELLDELGVIREKDRTEDQVDLMLWAEQIQKMAKEAKDRRDKSIGRRLTHAKNAGNSNGLKNLMTEAAAIIARPLEDLDADPLVINTESGVLRFSTRPGENDGGQNTPAPMVLLDVREHDRQQLLTKIMPVRHDPGAKCPLFMAFLERIQPVPEMRRFLQRWLGYSMTGLTAEQKFAFFYGAGANGKSVLVDLMARIMGDYAASAKIESITGRNRRGGGDATPDLMPLIGARFVRTSEPDEGQRLQEGLIKELTGGEPILVRALNENFVLVYPIFKLTVSGNHKPEIHGGDDGIWRRVLLVPFNVQIPADERDPELGAKLWAERDGIFAWLVQGLREYLRNGLQVPADVTAATQEYREDSDPVGAFLTLCCDVTGRADDRVTSKQMTTAFNFWLDDTGRGTWQPNTVSKRMKDKCDRWKSPSTGFSFSQVKASTMLYQGVRFRTAFLERFSLRDADPPPSTSSPRDQPYDAADL